MAQVVPSLAVIGTLDERASGVLKKLFADPLVADAPAKLKRSIRSQIQSSGDPVVFVDAAWLVDFKLQPFWDEIGQSLERVFVLLSSADQVAQLPSWARTNRCEYLFAPIHRSDVLGRLELLRLRRTDWGAPERGLMAVKPALSDEPQFPHLVECLHDPQSQRLDAKAIAAFFGLSVSEIARLLGREVSTVSKTPDGESLQASLAPFQRLAAGLLRLMGSEARVRLWMRAPNPALDSHAPMELLQQGKSIALAEFVQDLLEGRPA